jgi:hypothetical protein
MKKTIKSIERTPVQIRTTEQSAPLAQPKHKDNRLPIDREARRANRGLPTDDVLALLHTVNPDLFGLAEVVGEWIWVQFS